MAKRTNAALVIDNTSTTANQFKQSFIEESLEICGNISEILKKKMTEHDGEELFRMVHTMKSIINSLGETTLSETIHQAEEFIMSCRNQQQISHEKTKMILNAFQQHLSLCLQALKNNQTLPLIDAELTRQMSRIQQSPSLEVSQIAPVSHLKSPLSEKSQSLRIQHADLDEIQANLKKILQLKTQMNHFARQLGQEFSDEVFPKELSRMIGKLEEASLSALETLLKMRVQPLAHLFPFCRDLAETLCLKLHKKCQIIFLSDALEVDTSAIALVQVILTHLLRNAIDHGIELPEQRRALGKPEIGEIKISYQKLDNKTFRMEVKDDGSGIVRDKLRKVLISKKLLTEEQANALKDHQLVQMIFVDGITTKSEVSEISGRGVGISAVKNDIEKMGGSLQVESVEGHGTTFVIHLPLYFIL